MNMFTGERRFLGRSVLAATALFGLLAFAATPPAFAREDPYYKCQRRIAKADYKLHEAIERHGPYSRQAEHQRHELREARERCWKPSRDWSSTDGVPGGSGPGANTNGASTSGVSIIAITATEMVTGIVTKDSHTRWKQTFRK